MISSYKDFYQFLSDNLKGWEIILGNTADSISKDTCFITHNETHTTRADDGPAVIAWSSYDLVFLSKRAAFTNRQVIELLESGVKYVTYDEDLRLHVFAGRVVLFGPLSIPEE